MSQENVEIARQAWEALDRGELDVLEALAAPDAEIDQSRAVGTDCGVYTVAEFRRLTQQFMDTWDSVDWIADDFIDSGDHVVRLQTSPSEMTPSKPPGCRSRRCRRRTSSRPSGLRCPQPSEIPA